MEVSTSSLASLNEGSASQDTEDSKAIENGCEFLRVKKVAKFLPYWKLYEEEANEILHEIKFHLSLALQSEDYHLELLYWVKRLALYCSMYNLRITKPDYVSLVKILYNLACVPDLEPRVKDLCCNVGFTMMSYRAVIARTDLEVDWRPLYQCYYAMQHNSARDNGFLRTTETLERNFHLFVSKLRNHFPESASREIWEEFRCFLCPHFREDDFLRFGLKFLSWFLPVYPLNASDPYSIACRDELFKVWHVFSNMKYEVYLSSMFCRMTREWLGVLDWEPHLDRLFNFFIRCLSLPVAGFEGGEYDADTHSRLTGYTELIVLTITPVSSTLDRLSLLFSALGHFYHPSNSHDVAALLNFVLASFSFNFYERLRDERYRRPLIGFGQTPTEVRISDRDITRFVEVLLPVCLKALFQDGNTDNVTNALFYLSLMRPGLVVPPLLECFESACDSLIEPHRLTACLSVLSRVSLPMLQSPDFQLHPEGRLQCVSLIRAALPGLDVNDISKCKKSIELIRNVALLVRLEDVSDSVDDYKDPLERELCLMTGQFEDVLMEMMDRIFDLINNVSSTHAHEHRSPSTEASSREEDALWDNIPLLMVNVVQNCSLALRERLWERIMTFIKSSLFDSESITGTIGSIIAVFSWFLPEVSLSAFLPFFVRMLREQERVADGDELKVFFEGEKPDARLSWLLPCLFGVFDQNQAVLPWRDEILYIAKTLVRIRSSKVANYAALPIGSVVAALTVPRLQKATTAAAPTFFPRTNWQIYQSMEDTAPMLSKWYLPGEAEFKFATVLVEEILSYIFERLEGYLAKSIVLGPTELEALMYWLQGILAGGVCVFPLWQDELVPSDEVDLRPNLTKLTHHVCTVDDARPSVTYCGQNVRLTVANLLSRLLDYLPTQREDNAAAQAALVSVLQHCMCLEDEMKKLDNTADYRKLLKAFFKDGTVPSGLKPPYVRSLQLEWLHLKRFSVLPMKLNKTTWRFCQQLLGLAISPYEEVRRQTHKCLNSVWARYVLVADKILRVGILPYLANGNDHPEHVFQGALEYLSSCEECQVYYTSWSNRRAIYSVLVKAMQCKHADKPEIGGLLTQVIDILIERSDNIDLQDIVMEPSRRAELTVLSQSLCPVPGPTADQIETCQTKSRLRFERRLNHYKGLMDEVIGGCSSPNTSWNAIDQAINLLPLQVDGPLPQGLVEFALSNIVHPVPTVGTDAANLLNSILWSRRFRRNKVPVPSPPASDPGPAFRAGVRPDNLWRVYDFESRPITCKGDWDKTFFYGKEYLGYRWWPVNLKVCDWKDTAPNLGYTPSQQDVIYEFFKNEFIWNHLRKYLTSVYEEDESAMAVDEGEDELDLEFADFDKFPSSQLSYWLSRNYGDAFVDNILALIVDVLEQSMDDKRSVCHKLASSLLFGLLQGSKYWPHHLLASFWRRIVPDLMDLIFEKTTESQENYWLLRISELLVENAYEPQLLHPLIDYLFDRLAQWKHELYKEYLCCYWLSQICVSISWRGDSIVKRLLTLFPEYHQHDYKRLREISWVMLRTALSYDHHGFQGLFCRQKLLEEVVLPLLAKHTLTVVESKGIRPSQVTVTLAKRVKAIPNFRATEDSATAQLALEVLLNSLTMRHVSNSAPSAQMWTALLVLCDLRSCVGGEDQQLEMPLYRHLSCCASGVVNETNFAALADLIPQLSKHSSWKARLASLDFLQGVIFNNLFTFSREQRPSVMQAVVLDLLCDESVEVRKHAAVTLAGLLQCGYIAYSDALSLKLKQWSNRGVKRPRPTTDAIAGGGPSVPEINGFRYRHSGVLGLGAIVNAFPYDVPSFIPDILMEICRHATDPEPMRSSVKETVRNFTKTHHETWHFQKDLFSDDQLLILTDLLVSPNYYA